MFNEIINDKKKMINKDRHYLDVYNLLSVISHDSEYAMSRMIIIICLLTISHHFHIDIEIYFLS